MLKTPTKVDDARDLWEMIYACIALHNFIRVTDHTVDAQLLAQVLAQQLQLVEGRDAGDIHAAENDQADARLWRDHIAQEIWDNRYH